MFNVDKKLKGVEMMQGTVVERQMELGIRVRVKSHLSALKKQWVLLGQDLYAIYRDKLYNDWGYDSFEAYTLKELVLTKKESLALLRDYFYIECSRPSLTMVGCQPEIVPVQKSVSLSRGAKRLIDKKISPTHFAAIEEAALDELRHPIYVKNLISSCKEEYCAKDNKEAGDVVVEARQKELDMYLRWVESLLSDKVVVGDHRKGLQGVQENIVKELDRLMGF